MRRPPLLSERFLLYFHRDMERQPLPVCSMTGGSQILRNINGFMVYATNSPQEKTVPYGNTLQFPICWSMKSILEIWSRENTAVFHIRQSKTAPGRKRNGTGWREHTNPSLTVNSGTGYNLWWRKRQNHLQQAPSDCFPERHAA